MSSYEREQERLLALLADVPNDEDITDDCFSNTDSDGELFSNHDSETEQELDENDSNAVQSTTDKYIGKDGTIWNARAYKPTRTPIENIFTSTSRLTEFSKHVKTPRESWDLFFSFMDSILEYTNIYIIKMQQKYRDLKHARLADIDELNALFGLLYLAGLHKSSHVNVRDIWATDGTGLEIFPATMSYNRFQFLLRCIRFDNIENREERRNIDKLAPIREIFDIFNNNCMKFYNCGSLITVDEKLESFRGRCSFRQYIPSKPAKYGIKIFAAVDSETYYTSKLEVYCGQQPLGPFNFSNKPEEVVKRITNHLQDAGRNITIDNWCTTYSLAEYLLSKKTTLVGTIRKNKRFLPPIFSNAKNREVHSTIFGFTKNSTILSYIPKKK